MPKTIFGTTEKSNFILNMKPSTLQKWIGAMLMLCVIVPQIGNFVISATDGMSSFLAAFLYFTGFGSILFFIIAMLKKELTFKDNKIYWVVIFMAVWAFASYYGVVLRGGSSEDISTALEGELGRYEGLLSLFAYFGIFLLATAVTSTKTIRIIMDIIVGAGIVQAVIAVLQHIPGLNFLTKYADLTTLALKNVMLSSGLSDSPIFYGSFLTLVTGVALLGAIFDKNNKRALIYGASAVLFWLTGLFTSSIVPIIGVGCDIIIAGIIAAVKNKSAEKAGKLSAPLARFGVIFAAMAVIFAVVFFVQGIYIRDKAIAFYDANFRLFIALGYSHKLAEGETLYSIAWSRSLDFVKDHPILGVGPDCLVRAQLGNKLYEINQIDRSYNEYIYIAATRGLPALAAYVAWMAYVIKRGVGKIKNTAADNWYAAAMLTAVGAYFVQAFFSASSVTVTPLLWLMAGLLCAKKSISN